MSINKNNLPYFYEDTSQWVILPTGMEQQSAWEYTVIQDPIHPAQIIERLTHQYRYRFGSYFMSANTVDEWHYTENDGGSYAARIQGYRSYWEGTIQRDGLPTLQPEVAVMLGMTPDEEAIPPFIKTIPMIELLMLMDEAEAVYADCHVLSAHLPRPMGAPTNTPKDVASTLHQLRKKCGLVTTRGRAALLELMMEVTGTIVTNGGWHITQEELSRRQILIY